MDSLRALLIQRAARLQERPAVSAPAWGTLTWRAFRNRVEGVALGLMAGSPEGAVHCRGAGPWDWACEVACACCGLPWDPAAPAVDPLILGGPRFNDEDGRQAYHDRDHTLHLDTLFQEGLSHGELLRRLGRLNGVLGWDHETVVILPMDKLETPGVRGALWSALYAGGHAELREGRVKDWDPQPFEGLLHP